jgi:glycosyltransferase involved in cell wall biosynthesis
MKHLDSAGTQTARDWLGSRTISPAEPGSVLFHAGSTAFQAPGGGETQLVQTGRALEAMGHSIRPFVPWVDPIENFRLLHLFGMSREGLELARVAKRRGVPIVLSTICWIEPRALFALAPSKVLGGFQAAKWTLKQLIPKSGWRSELVALADALAPNSTAEGNQLVRYLGADPSRIWPVPNGVERRFREAGPDEFADRFGLRDFVLYVGRIEPRKNVLGLIRSTHRLGLPLVVIGDPVPGREAYAEACRFASDQTQWLPRIEHNDPLLASAYAAARVFALPSWFETPGLAALEAAIAGTPVVITPWGCTREYFGDLVRYVRPDRPAEIDRAIGAAWDEGAKAGLAECVETRYLWAAVARSTAELYETIAPAS